MFESQSFTPKNEQRKPQTVEAVGKVISESEAEDELGLLLANPEHKFLNENPKNRQYIEEAASAIDALSYARTKITERQRQTFRVEQFVTVEGIEPLSVDYEGVKSMISRIMLGAREIGRGGDAFVVIDRNEMRTLPPEICYKVALAERTPRGRNGISEEAELQGEFYDVAQKERLTIGIPIPFYTLEIGEKKIIAMEKLPAASVDDVLRGRGTLPDWFEIDDFCEQLKKAVAAFHQHHLFHRDMHFGNIMIRQGDRPRNSSEKIGYIIDFGLSGYGLEDMDPYKKEVAGSTFTYDNDYGIIEQVRKELHKLRRRIYGAPV